MPAPRFSALGLASRPSSGASFLLASCLCLASGLLVGCGEGTSGAETRAGEGAPAVPWGPELQALAKRVEAGDARGVLAALARRSLQGDGQDDPLQRVELEARARFLDGDSVGALRVLEGAKLDHMTDARLWALEAELFAAMGRGSAAEEALVRGQRLAGRTPELERANGILCLTRPGEVRNGLEALQRARQLHAELPFVDGPLAQAHLLNGRRRLADAPGEARAHARSGLALVPGQHELRELLAEAQEALGEFEEAIETLSALESEGVRFGERVALLHQRAATAALLGGRRDEALEHYASARERGLNDEGLGFGATALTDAAGDAVERGFAYLEAEEYPAAETAFRQKWPSCSIQT